MGKRTYQENLQITSQFKFCPNPFRVDMYRGCDFGCTYCFANMEAFKENGTGLKYWCEAEVKDITHKFELAFDTDKEYKEIIIELLRHKVPLHCGGMSDPFQSRENELGLTKELIKLSNKYNYPILFSTKACCFPKDKEDEYWKLLNPQLHAFQISLMGYSDEYVKRWELNTPSVSDRINFLKKLKEKGFWCSIRIQPIIDIIECELLMHKLQSLPDYYSIEHLHIIADSHLAKKTFEKYCDYKDNFFYNGTVIEFKPDIKINNVNRLISIANSYGVKVGAADNDLHYMSQSRCCCGIDLINENFSNYLKFNTTYLSTGKSNINELWIPKSNCRRHMNIGKGKPTVYIKDVVTQYIKQNPQLIPSPYHEDVFKQLFGTYNKKLF